MDIEKKYNARVNVCKMFKDRGYYYDNRKLGVLSKPTKTNLIDIENKISFEEFKILPDKDIDIKNIWNPYTERHVHVIYSNDDKNLSLSLYKTISSAGYSAKEDDLEKLLHVLIITMDETVFKKLDISHIELFNLNKLAISYINHRYQPIEIKLYRKSDKEYKEITDNFDAKNLKIIAKLDPVTKYYNASIDDIFLFNSIDFRIVKNILVKT